MGSSTDDTMASLQVEYDQAIAAAHGPRVYQAINAVQAELAAIGISKGHRNQQQGFMFRGIDDVYNVVSPLLAKHHLCILPRMVARTCDERQGKSGGALFSVTVEAEFDFVSSDDGSRHMVRTFGEAMDSGDKATNKAMSAAYKYAVVQGFAIPTEGDNDGDATTHEVEGAVLAKALRAIETSASMDVLKSHYQTAFLMLPAAQRGALEAAKDRRKAQLEGQTQ